MAGRKRASKAHARADKAQGGWTGQGSAAAWRGAHGDVDEGFVWLRRVRLAIEALDGSHGVQLAAVGGEGDVGAQGGLHHQDRVPALLLLMIDATDDERPVGVLDEHRLLERTAVPGLRAHVTPARARRLARQDDPRGRGEEVLFATDRRGAGEGGGGGVHLRQPHPKVFLGYEDAAPEQAPLLVVVVGEQAVAYARRRRPERGDLGAYDGLEYGGVDRLERVQDLGGPMAQEDA